VDRDPGRHAGEIRDTHRFEETHVPAANRTVTINRPVDQVFAFFADAENDPKWRPAVKHIKRIGPLAVGAQYEQQVAGPGGRSIPADIEVTAFEPNSYVAFRVIAGPCARRASTGSPARVERPR